MEFLDVKPGRLFVVAALLPLLAFVLLLLGGLLRVAVAPYRHRSSLALSLYGLMGGEQPLRAGGILATIAIGLSAFLSLDALSRFLTDPSSPAARAERWSERITWLKIGVGSSDSAPAMSLELGYSIDHLSAVLFAMVTCVSTCIFVFSLGYMHAESQPTVVEHEIRDEYGQYYYRRGRFGRFFLYLSLFCFAMLNLLIADNLFQVFLSWELVGVCSFFLIGFYVERPSATTAANKAFLMNRVGDAGFLVGIMIAWTSFGTLNFREIETRLRAPTNAEQAQMRPGELTRVQVTTPGEAKLDPAGTHLLLFPCAKQANAPTLASIDPRAVRLENDKSLRGFGTIRYSLFLLFGLGIFLGCVGKSAQLPLHTWLPDAMEGPTPVSALIHAATMVAAGVYLVGRVFGLLAPEVLLVIAYTGAITLFVAATIALVQTDIKRVLAYSTVSQLGYMMLALGIGAWTAGLLHLLTHAFFKALLFLGAGAVIHGCHHEQDMRKMGGLRRKMPWTANTMFLGVLAIIGTPLFSGWYSKEQIIGASLGYGIAHEQHMALFVLPLMTTVLTAFYMLRLWFMTFVNEPRDSEVFDHAEEVSFTMKLPLLLLAIASVVAGWGWPFWNPDSSLLGHTIEKAQPTAALTPFAESRHEADEHHNLVGLLALTATGFGVTLAVVLYAARPYRPENTPSLFGLREFLNAKWYFDTIYHALFVQTTVGAGYATAFLDKQAPKDGADREPLRPTSIDGLFSGVGWLAVGFGRLLRFGQTGQVRQYVLVLALTVIVLFAILSSLSKRA